ncbi:hypothetical protein D3C76_1037020 [compost metagenome]
MRPGGVVDRNQGMGERAPGWPWGSHARHRRQIWPALGPTGRRVNVQNDQGGDSSSSIPPAAVGRTIIASACRSLASLPAPGEPWPRHADEISGREVKGRDAFVWLDIEPLRAVSYYCGAIELRFIYSNT